MRMPDRAARRYLRQVRRWLPCSRKRKRAFLETVGRDIEEYLRETPEADYQALVRRFGSPIQTEEDYFGRNRHLGTDSRASADTKWIWAGPVKDPPPFYGWSDAM